MRSSLGRKAREFADTLQALLNQTVCDHAQVTVDITADRALVGTRLGGLMSEPVPLRSHARTRIWLDVQCRLTMDGDEGEFLAVEASYCGLKFGDSMEPLLHYDFERDKEQYTEAHLQVCASHPTFEAFLQETGRKGPGGLSKIHLPVGGRRFRPSLEDLLECLIDEGLVRPKAGWEQAIGRTRDEYRRKQIAAVVRRNTGTAQAELQRLGYRVVPPDDQRLLAKITRLITPRPRSGDQERGVGRQQQSGGGRRTSDRLSDMR
ncbi:hypothetical protein [Micromonospora craniellae]|uniref:Uncharacterized protein n=1 Tax=Micromonospora craniellae TaxID=2294034 RepID=A0A372G3C4_9ACTN|nr:hypothetical protein [Micromonospora craniellae]QOC91134.1 hypothetical protein ID554_24310 [Micromonospora craniellae]RFS47259.1 hypothetical protein D0Q02_06760 [Micromonospora craniellae]